MVEAVGSAAFAVLPARVTSECQRVGRLQDMALQQVNESDEEEYHSLSGSGNEPEDGEDDEAESVMQPPVHPVLSMQGAFEESILESGEESETDKSQEDADAERRREKLLEARQYDDAWTTRWKQKPGAQYHPLLKLMAQIVFGMHLLQQQQAKSNDEVVKILQTHVNEVDSFLERTSEDFDLAIADIEERMRHLKLPMQHLDVFNAMLDGWKFRTQLLDGNNKIEKIIDRTTKAMNAALMDVQNGRQAAKELGKYLDGVRERWPRQQSTIAEVFGAMRGNEQGWTRYLKDLQVKGKNLGNYLVELGTVTGDMSKLAAAASRRNRPHTRTLSSQSQSEPASPLLRSKFSPDAPSVHATRKLSLNKPLPREPDTVNGAVQMAVPPKPHPVPFAQRYEQPRRSPQSPPAHNRRISSAPPARSPPPRPKTAGEPRNEARHSQYGTSELAEFLKHSGPLCSNPPDHAMANGSTHKDIKTLSRSQSQGANDILNGVSTAETQAPLPRSKTHGPTAVIMTSRPGSRGADAVLNRPSSRGAEKAMSVKSMPSSRKDSVAR